MICAKCEWIVSPLDDKARRADHFGRSIERFRSAATPPVCANQVVGTLI